MRREAASTPFGVYRRRDMLRSKRAADRLANYQSLAGRSGT